MLIEIKELDKILSRISRLEDLIEVKEYKIKELEKRIKEFTDGHENVYTMMTDFIDRYELAQMDDVLSWYEIDNHIDVYVKDNFCLVKKGLIK